MRQYVVSSESTLKIHVRAQDGLDLFPEEAKAVAWPFAELHNQDLGVVWSFYDIERTGHNAISVVYEGDWSGEQAAER